MEVERKYPTLRIVKPYKIIKITKPIVFLYSKTFKSTTVGFASGKIIYIAEKTNPAKP